MERKKLLHFGFLKNYLCFAGLILVLLVPIYWEAHTLLEREVEENTRQSMEQGLEILADEIEAINGIIIRFPSHQYYAYVRSLKSPDQPEDYYALYSLRNYLADITTALSLPSQTIVWFSNNIIVTPATVYSRAEQRGSRIFHTDEADDMCQWFLSFADEEYQYQFKEAERFYTRENGDYTGLPLVHTYSSLGGREKAIYVSVFNLDHIYELMGLIDMKDQSHVVISSPASGGVIYDNGVEINGAGIHFQAVTGAAFLDFQVDVPKSYFARQFRGMWLIAVVYFLLFVTAAVVMAVVLAGRSALPVHKIVNTLSRYTEKENGKEPANYRDIERSIEQIGDKSLAVSHAHDRLGGELYRWLLREQIVNGLEGKKLERLLQDGEEVREPFRLVVIQTVRPQGAPSAEDMGCHVKESGIGVLFFCKVKEHLFLCVVREEGKDKLKERLNGLAARLEERTDTGCVISVSVVMTGLEHIHEQYQTCRYSMKYLSVQKMIFQDEINRQRDPGRTGPDLMENVKLTDLVLAGRREEAEGIISRQWYQVSIGREYSMMEQLYYMQAAVLNQLAVRLGSTDCAAPMGYSDGIFEAEAEMLRLAGNLCELAKKRIEDSKNDLPRKIVEYIDAHYMEPEFYLGSLEKEFGLSDKTITRLVKSYTSRSFSQYLGNLRMKMARVLLENQKLSIEEVAAKSGFGSENTFYKAFKRIYNVSPTTYRGNLEGLKEEGEG